jgi:hypothetical protein
MRFFIAFSIIFFAALPAQARPVVVELFTSEACSSCPPAEALLAGLKTNPNVLPLAFHVTYWNGPAWTDEYSLEGATDRQSFYAGVQHSQDVYTPEAVVDGTAGMVGSNRAAVLAAIQAAASAQGPDVPVHVSGGAMITVSVGAGSGAATIWLFGFDGMHTTRIGGGENGGATLKEVNVVRSITSLGGWSGTAMTYTMPKPAGEHMAVLLQEADGVVLGAGAD